MVLWFVFINFTPKSEKRSQKMPGLKYRITTGKRALQLLLFSNCCIYFRELKASLLIKEWFSFDHKSDQSLSNVRSLRNARLWVEIPLWDFTDHGGLVSCFRVRWPQAWGQREGGILCTSIVCICTRDGERVSIPTFVSQSGWQSIEHELLVAVYLCLVPLENKGCLGNGSWPVIRPLSW